MNLDAYCCCLVAQSCPAVLRPHRLLLTRLLCPWDSPGKNTGVGWRALLHGIFLTQESNLSLLHWQGYSLSLSHQRSPHMNLQLGKIIYHKAYFIIKCWLVHVIYWLLYLEKGMTIHSSILAWRVPWTERPGGLQFVGLQKIRHDWATNTHAYTQLSVGSGRAARQEVWNDVCCCVLPEDGRILQAYLCSHETRSW